MLNRKIKATIGMLADPAFDGLDELKTSLVELKAKRDALETKPRKSTPTKIPSADELRRWATERFGRIEQLVSGPNPSLQNLQLVEAFVNRIEVDPDAKQATIYSYADLESAYKTRGTRKPAGEDEYPPPESKG